MKGGAIDRPGLKEIEADMLQYLSSSHNTPNVSVSMFSPNCTQQSLQCDTHNAGIERGINSVGRKKDQAYKTFRLELQSMTSLCLGRLNP